MFTSLDLPQVILTDAQGVATACKTRLQAMVIEGLRTVLLAAASVSKQALTRLRTGLNLKTLKGFNKFH